MTPARKKAGRPVPVKTDTQQRILIVAEGTLDESASKPKRQAFERLWQELSDGVSTGGDCRPPAITAVGFSKSAIVLLDAPQATAKNLAKPGVPLDTLIAEHWTRTKPNRTIVAFDLWPANELLDGACRVNEVEFILTRMLENRRLPEPLHRAANALVGHYQSAPKASRQVVSALELVCMEPEFEALPACDEQALKTALSIGKVKDWPWNETRAMDDPKGLLGAVVKLRTPPNVKRPEWGAFEDNPHGWARAFIAAARKLDNAAMFQHPIAQRLARLLC